MSGHYSIGFIGAGQMATALALGWKENGLLNISSSLAADPSGEARHKFSTVTGIRCVEDNLAVLKSCEIVIIAVKPQMIGTASELIAPQVTTKHLIISIVAGVSIETLSDLLGDNPRLIRVMPNTPALVGRGATALSPGAHATPQDVQIAQMLFDAVGLTVVVPESQMDAVTGLSGSGPAFVYTFIEALSDGGVRMGLPRAIARKLAAQTVLGAAKMVLNTDSHPAALRDAVTSPGGTTIAGMHALEESAFRAACINAVVAATERSMELGG